VTTKEQPDGGLRITADSHSDGVRHHVEFDVTPEERKQIEYTYEHQLDATWKLTVGQNRRRMHGRVTSMAMAIDRANKRSSAVWIPVIDLDETFVEIEVGPDGAPRRTDDYEYRRSDDGTYERITYTPLD
jgi:hypothetical protein